MVCPKIYPHIHTSLGRYGYLSFHRSLHDIGIGMDKNLYLAHTLALCGQYYPAVYTSIFHFQAY